VSYYIPDRTEGFCIMECEKGVKFTTLYPRRFFFFPSLTVERDWNSLTSGFLCPYLGILVLTLSIGWEPLSLANAGLIPWRYIVFPSDLVKSDRTVCWNALLLGIKDCQWKCCCLLQSGYFIIFVLTAGIPSAFYVSRSLLFAAGGRFWNASLFIWFYLTVSSV